MNLSDSSPLADTEAPWRQRGRRLVLYLVEPTVAAKTRPLSAGEEVFQSTSLASPPSPVDAAPAVLWVGQAAAPPVAEAPVPLPTIPPAEAATASDARATMALAQDDTVLPKHDASPASRPRPESQERAAATVPSVAPLATDSALPLASSRATSHIPSAEPAIAVPTLSPSPEDTRPWPLPSPTNMVMLHLEPRELGALRPQVRVYDKHPTASFQAQSAEAEMLLRTHLPGLHESLSQHGFEVQSIAITRAAEDAARTWVLVLGHLRIITWPFKPLPQSSKLPMLARHRVRSTSIEHHTGPLSGGRVSSMSSCERAHGYPLPIIRSLRTYERE